MIRCPDISHYEKVPLAFISESRLQHCSSEAARGSDGREGGAQSPATAVRPISPHDFSFVCIMAHVSAGKPYRNADPETDRKPTESQRKTKDMLNGPLERHSRASRGDSKGWARLV